MLELGLGISEETREEVESFIILAVDWYRKQHLVYNNKLKDEMIDQMIGSLNDNFGAKLSLYSVYDILQKFVLYRFSEMPPSDGTVQLPLKRWSEQKSNALEMVEVVHVMRKRANEGKQIDLSAGLEDRTVRNNLTHSGKLSKCISAIRCYNVVRDMIIFLDDERASQLPMFDYPTELDFDIQSFLELTDNLEAEDSTTMLVVDAVHDIPYEQKKIVANLPWDIVIDFDGSSDFGGLRSCVEHPMVSDRRLSVANARHMQFTKGFTTWLSLSDFVNYAYTPSGNRPPVRGVSFSDDSRNTRRDTTYLIQDLLSNNLIVSRTAGLTIVYMRPWDSVGQELLNVALNEYGDSLRFAYIYNFDEDRVRNSLADIFAGRNILQETCCREYNTPLPRFYETMDKYQDILDLKTQQPETLRVPSADGMKDISPNIFENLSGYFEVLHEAIGRVPEDQSQQEIKDFYHGAMVPWSAFFYDEVVNLFGQDDFNRIVHKIRTVLGSVPDILRHKLFYIQHQPGIGGTTLLRQLAWNLHTEYPVLVLKKYERGKINERIRQLYDMHAKKGILIVADEGQFTSTELEDLERDIISNERACALIIAVHSISQERASSPNIVHLRALANGQVKMMKLRTQVKKYSTLSPDELRLKDANFHDFVEQDLSMRFPFIIGLYYLEKQFNGVQDYVANILRQVEDEIELKAMSVIALADYYGRIGFPSQVIHHYLGIRQSYLKTHSYAKGVFIKRSDENGNSVYRSKHYLISQHILDQVSKKLYGGEHEEFLEQHSIVLITMITDACKQMTYNNYYGNVLERVFIKYKYGIGYDAEKQVESEFATLIETVKLPETREKILKFLAKSFAHVVERFDPEKHSAAFFTVAHFYGHLSRVYTKSNIGLRNDDEALENCRIALDYLEKVKKEDSYIYHMYGTALMRAFQTRLGQLDKSSVSDAELENLEDEIALAAGMFEKSSQNGSVTYGVLSKLELYMDYLQFVYAVKRISDVAKLKLLSRRQMDLRSEIEEMFAQLDGMEMDTLSRSKFVRFESAYRSELMFHNFGKAVEYYNNRLSELKRSSASSELDIIVTTQGLITALIGKHRNTTENGFSYFENIPSEDANRILELIETSVEYAFDKTKYHERQRRIGLCYRWLQIAKFSERPISQAIEIADQWAKLDPKDARPFYYLYTLHYLRAMDGYQDSLKEAERHRRKCYHTISSRHQSEEELDIRRIRDVVVDGKGIGRLKDVRNDKNLPEYVITIKPMKFYGSFTQSKPKKGFVNLIDPKGLYGVEAKFTVGQGNTLSDQYGHKLVFYAGFTLERMHAIDHFVRDLTSGEEL